MEPVTDPALIAWCKAQLDAFDALPAPVRERIAAAPNQLDADYFRSYWLNLCARHKRWGEKRRIKALLAELDAVEALAHEHHERVMAGALSVEIMIPGGRR
jgi:hypothetical protein